ncbi:MAG: dienelactone hydrolase family protein, partial [Nitrososphaerales archaeon]
MVNRRSALKALVGAIVAVGAGISAVFLTRRSPEKTEEVREESQQPPEVREEIEAPTEAVGEEDPPYLGLAAVFNGKPKMPVTTEIIGTKVQGMIASPTAPGKYPGIVMIHEWWGLSDQVKSMAHILAGEGYVVFAVDLFDGNVATTPQDARANIQNHPSDETVPKLRAAVGYLRMEA